MVDCEGNHCAAHIRSPNAVREVGNTVAKVDILA